MAARFVVENGTGIASVITAGGFVSGLTYEIVTIGTTDFTTVGATANTVGLEFVASGVGTGTGTASIVTLANSYLSIVDADQYHADIGTPAAKWASLDAAVKEQALRNGTRYLDSKYVRRWKGRRSNKANPLDWPRSGVVDADSHTVASNELPRQLEEACAEVALRSGDTTQNPTGLTPDITQEGVVTLKREKLEGVGEEETEWDGGFSPYVTFTVVERILRDIVESTQGAIR